MAQKPSIPKGTRDFSPIEMARRNYIFNTIRNVFQQYGYQPVETPAMENLNTLMGKYGEEGDRLLFKILNSGDFLKGFDKDKIADTGTNKLAASICEKGLRYDLTVPFARYVVQHRNDIVFPFKRYQIQPVWRADRPQKGRYREFYQCDVDVIGSDSLLNELELIRMIDDIFKELKIKITIKVNNRKILSGMSQLIEKPEMLTELTTAIDKLDKIGLENVVKELEERGLERKKIDSILPILTLKGSNDEKLEILSVTIGKKEEGGKGIDELRTLFSMVSEMDFTANIELDPSLARGLNYYTGAIIEVQANDVSIGSICGGGRYDNLTGIFGLPGVSGVGVSFGADRIYDVLNEKKRFPGEIEQSVDVMFVNFGEKEARFCLKIIKVLHQSGISAELYPDADKMKKQMRYANAKAVKFVMLIGEEEMKSGLFTLKEMKTGEQEKGKLSELIKRIKF